MDQHAIDAQTAGEILDEVSQAAQESEAVLAADAGAEPTPRAPVGDVQRQAQIERLQRIAKARRQRERGIKELHNTYTGVMSVRREASINDPVVASTLQRYFGLIDRSYHIIGRRGPDIIGAEATERVLGTIEARIDEFSQDVRQEAAAAKALREEDASGDDFVCPQYTSSAAQEVVFAKHRKTLDLLDALILADRLIEDLNIMSWNGKVEPDKIEDTRFRIKKQISRIFSFSESTMRGMMNRITPKAPGADIGAPTSIVESDAQHVAAAEGGTVADLIAMP